MRTSPAPPSKSKSSKPERSKSEEQSSSPPSEKSTASVEETKIAAPLFLYPYQKKWIEDKCRLKIASKARRIGYSFAAGFGHVERCLEAGMQGRKENQIILSRGERQAKEFISESVQ
jgi:hypothetical protein